MLVTRDRSTTFVLFKNDSLTIRDGGGPILFEWYCFALYGLLQRWRQGVLSHRRRVLGMCF